MLTSADAAQQWTYSGGKLKHNGLCLNDQRSGGNGSKVILYTCNGGANETWTLKSNGEFVLKANGGKYCLDNPASSKHNGTQLIVWACHTPPTSTGSPRRRASPAVSRSAVIGVAVGVAAAWLGLRVTGQQAGAEL